MKISICIPTYEMHGVGPQMLSRCLDSVNRQSFKDIEIIVSDNSKDNGVYDVCRSYPVRYLRNPIIGMAANTNNGIKKAQGELIKILYQDDYLAPDSLKDISDVFGPKTSWLIQACSNNPKPFFSKSENTLGSPSVLTIRNKDPLLFDEDLSWVLDLDYYKRMFDLYGQPKILNKVGVIMGLGAWQHTYHMSDEDKINEQNIYASGLR